MVESTSYLPSQTILIVDDTPHILQLLFNLLKNAGYRILIANNGKKALKTAEAMQPDLIILDVMMPVMDGFSTCSHLKANSDTKNIPVIFMTALAQTEEKVQGFALGAVDYITKPIEERELLARINTHLSLQSLNQRLAKDAARQKLLGQISDRIRKSLNLNLILETASQEIRAFLDCDFVGLIHLKEQNLSIKAYDAVEDITTKLNNISYKDICPDRDEYQSYLLGNIKIIKTENSSNPLQARLIAPILINNTDISTVNSKATPAKYLTTLNNVLWGWLVADQYQVLREWQLEEISLVQELTNQLSIGIKQGQLYKQLSDLALLDSLTRAYNRRYFDRQLTSEWRRLKRNPSPLSLIMCDVDYFKIYNDTYGHQEGDKCLQQIVQAISSVLKRPADTLARYGGEEFAVILPHTPESGAVQVAEAMRNAVKELNIPHLNSLTDSVVTISVGVASTVPNFADNPRLLIEAGDLALYQAKKRGRNCVIAYSEPISNSKDRQEFKVRWVKRIRHALKNDLFSLYAQSITPLETKDTKKYFEILLRLTDEENKVILPHTFLGIAEQNLLMSDIDTWVINNLFEQLATKCDRSAWDDYRFSINLSGASLNSESFMEFLTQKLLHSDFPAQLFCFEITETIAVADLPRVVEFIKSLKNLGCSFALDDFGKGMSSLTYLQNLPVDYLKIDGSFIKELNNTRKSSKFMVEAINHIAEGIGLKTVAEFVENQSILDTVRELKVDYAQGFHLGRPGILMDVVNKELLLQNY